MTKSGASGSFIKRLAGNLTGKPRAGGAEPPKTRPKTSPKLAPKPAAQPAQQPAAQPAQQPAPKAAAKPAGYAFPFAEMPFFGANAALNARLSDAAVRLEKRLKPIAPRLKEIGMSPYSQRYMDTVFGTPFRRNYNLTKYAHILSNALEKFDPAALSGVTFVDYGGGHGVLSLLARELGVGQVIHSDIFPTSSRDAQLLVNETGLRSGLFFVGDTDDFARQMGFFQQEADVIANYDVLEHVYSFRTYFADLAAVTKPGGRWYMGSGANLYNDRLREHLLEVHAANEGDAESENEACYHRVRAKRIAETYPRLLPEEVAALAVATRGWRGPDIDRAVDIYLSSGRMVSFEPPLNNTSDPRNGNWNENMVPVETYTENPLLRSLAADIAVEGAAEWSVFIKNEEDGMAAARAAAGLAVEETLKTAPYYCLRADF